MVGGARRLRHDYDALEAAALLDGKRVVVTGGTGSLGQVLVRRLLEGELGVPEEVVVFSRDEAKQHAMRLAFQHRRVATDEIVYDEERHQPAALPDRRHPRLRRGLGRAARAPTSSSTPPR